MIGALVRWSIRHRVLVLVSTGVFGLITSVLASRLELDALPDITTNQVLILTRAPGLTPEEVERRVTRTLEVSLGGIPGLKEHRSLSRYGISSITAVFGDGEDPYRARQLVQERLATVSGGLPQGVESPELGPLTGGLGEIFHFTVGSPARTTAELLEMVEVRVAPLLRAVAGVVEVNTWGGEKRTLDVLADPLRLAQRGLTLEDLRAALVEATGAAPGAALPGGGGRQSLLRAVAYPADATALAMAMVAPPGADGAPVRVADVAEVRAGSQPRIGAATANGRGETVYVMAQMLRGANALEVMERIHAALPTLKRVLPEDVRLDVVYDRSELVDATLETVASSLLEGGLLVVVVLLAMLGSFRAGLIVALAIPLSMLGALAAMVLVGVPGNLMSLGAIDFGLVVDGSVVMVERVFHTLRPGQGPDRERPFRERLATVAASVAPPMFFGVLVIVLVYVPVLSLTGVDGKMFRPMAFTVVLALGTSLLLALTFVPAALSVFVRPEHIPRRDPWLPRLHDRLYRPVLRRALRHPWGVAAGAVALLVGGTVLFMRAGTELVPQLDEGDLVIQTARPADVSLDTAVRGAQRLESAVLRAVPEATQVVSRVGSPAVATDIMGIEQADVFVRLVPRDRWRPGVGRDHIIAEIDAALKVQDPEAEPSFTQPIQMRFNELLAGAVTDVTVAIHGQDLGELRRIGEAVVQAVRGQPGVADVHLLAPPDVPAVEVRPLPLAASQVGLSPRQVMEAVQAVRAGIEVGVTFDGPVRVPIRLRLQSAISAFDVETLGIPTRTGAVVPLGRVAQVSRGRAPTLVSHLQGERRLLVGFNVRGADLGRTVATAAARVEEAVALPDGYRLEWGGQYHALEEAQRRLAVVVPVVVVLILGVLAVAFRRLQPALVVFLNVPFACVGGIAALVVRGMPVSLSAAVGFIALSGIAVLNGVVLISRVLSAEAEGRSPAEAMEEGARSRVRPVVTTALVAALGFVPMALATGVGAEVQRPLATVVIGGLVTSTLLTLVIVPALYPRLAVRRRRQGQAAASINRPPGG